MLVNIGTAERRVLKFARETLETECRRYAFDANMYELGIDTDTGRRASQKRRELTAAIDLLNLWLNPPKEF